MKKILEKFDGGDYEFATAAKDFKLIEENTVMVYIDQEPEAKALLQEIRQQGLTKSRMRKAGQYCVSVRKKGEYEKRNMLFDEMYRAGMLEEVDPGAKDFWVLTQEEQYREDTGLKLEVEAVLSDHPAVPGSSARSALRPDQHSARFWLRYAVHPVPQCRSHPRSH